MRDEAKGVRLELPEGGTTTTIPPPNITRITRKMALMKIHMTHSTFSLPAFHRLISLTGKALNRTEAVSAHATFNLAWYTPLLEELFHLVLLRSVGNYTVGQLYMY